MTQIHKFVAFYAVVAGAFICSSGFAQDDLDDLLKDLEAESTSTESAVAPAAAVAPSPAPAVEAPAPVAEAPAPIAEEPASTQQVDEVLSVLGSLAEESGEAPVAVATGVVAGGSAAAPANSDAELLANIAATEEIRRKALDEQAKREINEARQCMSAAEYTEAVRHYGFATKLLNDRPAVKNLRRECDQGIAEGLYRAALQEKDLGHRTQAIRLMEKAVDMRHPRARRILEKWVDEDATVEKKTSISDIAHRKNDVDYKAQREQIKKHLRRSYQYFAVKDLTKALEECEIVLVNDPYNTEALRIRHLIQQKRQAILEQERVAAREGMIADVDKAWRPVYAVNASRLGEAEKETVKTQTGDNSEQTQEQIIERRMKEMRLPNISFKPPATIIDAVEFFRQASKDYDRPDIPLEKRGFNFVLRTPQGAIKQQVVEEDANDFTSSASDASSTPTNGLDPIQTITASDISFYEAMKLVCESVNYKFIVRGQVVMVMPSDMSTQELVTGTYNVPEAFVERVSSASDEIKQMGGFGANKKAQNSEEGGEEQDWKAFFAEMGIKWPEGSSIKHIKALGKLYVRNTRENLAEFEKVLEELGGQPQLIEIETRFVEVSQEDLNSLGFEWLMNSDYNLAIGEKLGHALGIREAAFQNVTSGGTTSSQTSTIYTRDAGGNVIQSQTSYTPIGAGATTSTKWMLGGTEGRNLGINAIAGVTDFSDTTTFGNGNRFLSTTGNHIAGESKAYNDQFMRVNAFLGNADLSMILHMLAQRSDTDLLSAPKVVTKSGENAVIKVVTEYIYPQDYDVQLQSSSSSSSGNGYGSNSAVLAIVKPENFTMREVGVILDVLPTYSELNGGTIDLELKPQVVDEPTWKNYGMKIPFTGNANNIEIPALGDGPFPNNPPPPSIIETITTRYWNAVSTMFENLTGTSSQNITYYEAPMEQPWFHVRSIDSKVSITPGSTVVMGGLITEQRKAMDDKVPFLGDLPFIGRLFRSHAEQTIKRNLLIFVTGRLITPSGRELRVGQERIDASSVTAAPTVD